MREDERRCENVGVRKWVEERGIYRCGSGLGWEGKYLNLNMKKKIKNKK